MDPEVIDIPWLLRWILVHVLILPKRAGESAELYKKIWTEDGSPLIHHSRRFSAALARALDDTPNLEVGLGMRYGNPSIGAALDQMTLSRLDRLIVFPLYPQYAQSSTLTAQRQVLADLKSCGHGHLKPEWIEPFYSDPQYLEAVAATARPVLETFTPDLFLFSFHGLPERHVKKLHTVCLSDETCCDRVTSANANCYRAQCFATAHAVASRLDLAADRYRVSFQSRLGRTPWIRPYTDYVIEELPAQGVRRLAVFCPSFVADCLETLDEIENRENERFLKAGGEELRLIPSLNDSPAWVDAAARLVRDRFA
jgi:ferrochelatase